VGSAKTLRAADAVTRKVELMTPEAYRARMLETLPAMADFLARTCQHGSAPSAADLRAAVDVGYASMLQNPDVHAAARAVRAYLQDVVRAPKA
jgi:hypothetical protein